MFSTETFINTPEPPWFDDSQPDWPHVDKIRCHSSILDARCFRRADCYTDLYL